MYSFEDYRQIPSNIARIQKKLTSECYSFIYPDDDRVIFFYYRFKAEPTSVIVHYSSPSMVVFSFNNSVLDSSTQYVAYFSRNSQGKIASIIEYEVIP